MPNDTVISITDHINPEYFSKGENEIEDGKEKGSREPQFGCDLQDNVVGTFVFCF